MCPLQGFESEYDTNGGRLRYVQIVDAGRKVIASGCGSHVMSHVVGLLHSVRATRSAPEGPHP